jgi:hypothetical protein
LLDESPQFFVCNRDGRLNMQSALILKAFDTVFIITMKPEFHDSPGKPNDAPVKSRCEFKRKGQKWHQEGKKGGLFRDRLLQVTIA